MKKVPEEIIKADVFDPALVTTRLTKWFPKVSAPTIKKLVEYQGALFRSNKTMNLVPSNSLKNADAVHVGDCVLASHLIAPQLVAGQPLYDLASGAGLPGLIFAILNPSVKVILVDKDQRRMEFCKEVMGLLALDNVTLVVRPVEELADGALVNVMTRDFIPFSKVLILLRKQVAKGGKFFHLKEDGWANELASMPSQVFSHWSPSVVGQYQIPDSTAQRFVVLTEKIAA